MFIDPLLTSLVCALTAHAGRTQQDDAAAACEHFSAIRDVPARTNGCEECLTLGEAWNQLRVCLTCGHVGCCEDSAHAHAFRHFQATGHPMLASFEPEDNWGWCYVHRRYFDPMPGRIPKRRSALGYWLRRIAARILPGSRKS